MLNPFGVIILLVAIFSIILFISAVINLIITKIQQKRDRAMRLRLTTPRT